MQEENLTILRALKQNFEELAPPIEAAQQEIYGEDQEGLQSGLDFNNERPNHDGGDANQYR